MLVLTSTAQYTIGKFVLRKKAALFGYSIYDVQSRQLKRLCKELFFWEPKKIFFSFPPDADPFMVAWYAEGPIKLRISIGDKEIAEHLMI